MDVSNMKKQLILLIITFIMIISIIALIIASGAKPPPIDITKKITHQINKNEYYNALILIEKNYDYFQTNDSLRFEYLWYKADIFWKLTKIYEIGFLNSYLSGMWKTLKNHLKNY